jgi:hypothetical protein
MLQLRVVPTFEMYKLIAYLCKKWDVEYGLRVVVRLFHGDRTKSPPLWITETDRKTIARDVVLLANVHDALDSEGYTYMVYALIPDKIALTRCNPKSVERDIPSPSVVETDSFAHLGGKGTSLSDYVLQPSDGRAVSRILQENHAQYPPCDDNVFLGRQNEALFSKFSITSFDDSDNNVADACNPDTPCDLLSSFSDTVSGLGW